MLGAFVICGLFVPVGARFFASAPITHFAWECVSIFILFFLLRTLTNYVLALNIGAMVTNVFGIWYLSGPGEHNVELSLWQVAATGIGVLVTIAVELVFFSFSHADEVIDGVDARLKQIEDLMDSYAANRPASPETSNMLAQYAVVGVGALRTNIARTATDSRSHGLRRNALVSLTGRSIDMAAALSSLEVTRINQQRAAQLARRIAEIRQCLKTNRHPASWEPQASTDTPLFSELESMISLIPSVFSSESSIDPRLEVVDTPPSSNRIFVDDAFSNPEHLTFVLGGTLAAVSCYLLYVSLDWPGISTSVTTCVFTALSNVGSSRQKQILRIAGAVLGAFVFGLGSQIFILPYLDSITGFTLLFAAVTAVAAWVSTSSTRLSYAGLQIALAFYLIILSEPRFQTSLTIGRDRAIGVLLGISMMWLFFERFYPRPAGDEMVRIFIRNLRLMDELIMTSSEIADTAAIARIRQQRNQINRLFGDVNAQSDAVPFETGPARAADMSARDRIRRWQASLRTFYILETPLLQFRMFGDISEQARPFAQMEKVFREQCAQSFRHIADCLENQLNKKPFDCSAPRSVLQLLDTLEVDQRDALTEREKALLLTTQTIASIVDRLQNEVAAEPLYATA